MQKFFFQHFSLNAPILHKFLFEQSTVLFRKTYFIL